MDDKRCGSCHYPEWVQEYAASIRGAHIAPDKSSQSRKPVMQILDITNTGPGQGPTVRFKITDKDGKTIAPSTLA